jgi:hypothetical protein
MVKHYYIYILLDFKIIMPTIQGTTKLMASAGFSGIAINLLM